MKKFDTPIHVTKSFLPPFEEYTREIERVWNSSWLTNNGIIHQEFEEEVGIYLNAKNITLFVNGHLALESAIKSLGITGEVITTPFTFASTTHAIVNCGLKPVFCDIDLNNFNIDINKIEALITKNTSAIIPVHVFGNPCDVKSLEKIAKKYNLKIIYDSAHAFGVKVDQIPIGNYGDISMFSLHATKVFHSIEGGLLTYQNRSYKKTLDLLKNFGISGPENIELVGVNAKMNEFQAAMGLVNLRYLDEQIIKRRKITEKYRELLEGLKGIKFLKDIHGIEHNYAYFPVLVDDGNSNITRDDLHEKLKESNVYTRKYFYPLCIDFDCYKEYSDSYQVPVARFVGDRVLTLPIYPNLELEDVGTICENIWMILKGHCN